MEIKKLNQDFTDEEIDSLTVFFLDGGLEDSSLDNPRLNRVGSYASEWLGELAAAITYPDTNVVPFRSKDN